MNDELMAEIAQFQERWSKALVDPQELNAFMDYAVPELLAELRRERAERDRFEMILRNIATDLPLEVGSVFRVEVERDRFAVMAHVAGYPAHSLAQAVETALQLSGSSVNEETE